MSLGVSIDARDAISPKMSRLIQALEAKRALHSRVAITAEEATKSHLREMHQTMDHKSARRVGAEPSGHLERMANRIEGKWSDDHASVLGPRRSRLRAAFSDYTVRPTGGRKFLAIPASRETYGRNARDFGKQLMFAYVEVLEKKWPALVFRQDGRRAFWLVKKTKILQDRSLLPFDQYLPILIDETKGVIAEALRDDDERKGGQA